MRAGKGEEGEEEGDQARGRGGYLSKGALTMNSTFADICWVSTSLLNEFRSFSSSLFRQLPRIMSFTC
jgi:hypothetical protein